MISVGPLVRVLCNLCGADDTKPWGRPKEGLTLVRCRKCGLIYVNPRPSTQALEALYSQDYFDQGEYVDDPRRRRMYEIEILRMLPLIGGRGRFLDVGCAMGMFLKMLPDSFEKHGVEFSSSAARHARETFGLDVRTGQLADANFEPGSFDVIQMRGVIEHLEDPSRQVRAASRLLKPGGWFVLNQTPNAGGASGWFYRELYNQVKPWEHLYYFTTSTIRHLLKSAGLVVRGFWFPYWGTPYAAPIKDFPRFVFNRFCGRESPAFPGNMMAVYSQRQEGTHG